MSTAATWWTPAVRKEVRALAPTWAVVLLAAVLAGTLPLAVPFLAVYFIGAAILGALSIGHEYSAGTLATLLAEPRRRQDLLRTKFTVLASMLAILGIVSYAVVVRQFRSDGLAPPPLGELRLTFVLCALSGLTIAPSFAMIFRSTIAGTVFTIAVPLVWILVGHAAASVVNAGMFLTCAAGAVVGWHRFMRLEALDNRPFDVPLPSWVRRRMPAGTADAPPPVISRHWVWRVVTKEVRLQQMPFLAAGLYFGVWTVAVLVAGRSHDLPRGLLELTVVYRVLNALLIGSVAPAEERQLGTAEWQAVLPVRTSVQWVVKIMTAFGATALLTVALPDLLVWLSPTAGALVRGYVEIPWLLTLLAFTAIALYVSSLSRSGLWAFVVSVPVMIGVAVAMRASASVRYSSSVQRVAHAWETLLAWLAPHGLPPGVREAAGTLIDARLWFTAGLAILVLCFAWSNHRSAERVASRVWRQALWMALYVLVACNLQYIVVVAGAADSDWAIRTRHTQHWQAAIDRVVRGFHGQTGIAVLGTHPTAVAGIADLLPFPMQSVVKVPLAIAVLQAVDQGDLRLDDPVVVRRSDLSVYVEPIASLVGPDGFKTTIGDLLRRAIVDSDNAAADILMARVGGPARVQAALGKAAPGSIRIDRDEKHLQSEINGLVWRDEYVDPAVFDRAVSAVPPAVRKAALQEYLFDARDTSSPIAMASLLANLDEGRLLSPESTRRLLDLLSQTKTFPDRLAAGLGPGWTIGHKPGTSRTWNGITAATNDVGILRGPDGGTVYVAVFIANSNASAADRAALIANIARAIVAGY